MNARMVFALIVATILICLKWRQTTSLRGMLAVKPLRTTARCYAVTAIDVRAESKDQKKLDELRSQHLRTPYNEKDRIVFYTV